MSIRSLLGALRKPPKPGLTLGRLVGVVSGGVALAALALFATSGPGVRLNPLAAATQTGSLFKEVTAGGILIPDNAKEKPTKGEVLAVGEGKALDNGSTRAPKVKVGDKVLFGKYAGTEVKLDGVEYLIAKEDDIFAILG